MDLDSPHGQCRKSNCISVYLLVNKQLIIRLSIKLPTFCNLPQPSTTFTSWDSEVQARRMFPIGLERTTWHDLVSARSLLIGPSSFLVGLTSCHADTPVPLFWQRWYRELSTAQITYHAAVIVLLNLQYSWQCC